MHSLTFTPGSIQTTTFLLFSRPPRSISTCKQVELALVLCELSEIRLFHIVAKMFQPTKKFKNQFLLEIIFQIVPYFIYICIQAVKLLILSMQLLRPVFPV